MPPTLLFAPMGFRKAIRRFQARTNAYTKMFRASIAPRTPIRRGANLAFASPTYNKVEHVSYTGAAPRVTGRLHPWARTIFQDEGRCRSRPR